LPDLRESRPIITLSFLPLFRSLSQCAYAAVYLMISGGVSPVPMTPLIPEMDLINVIIGNFDKNRHSQVFSESAYIF
jgi:hypothetical protein